VPIDEMSRFVPKSLLFLLFIVGFMCGPGGAIARDIHNLKFAPLKVQGEAPSGQVDGIIKGPDGFIWFATKEGAHRYDGYSIKRYAHDKEDPHSLINSQALCFHIDAQNRLWIGTQMGISRYNSELDSFDNYLLDSQDLNSNLRNHVNSIIHDSEGRIYASSEEGFVFRYSEEEDRFERLNASSFGIIKSMIIDDQDRIWTGSKDDVFRFSPSTGEAKRFSGAFGTDVESAQNFINSILYINEEEIWLGTSTRGALKYNSLTNEVEELVGAGPSEAYVHIIKRDEYGNIWIGHNGGVRILPNDKQEAVVYDANSAAGPLPSSGVHTLFVDDQDNIWVGSAFHGIYVSTNNKSFKTMETFDTGDAPKREPVISSLLYDHEGKLWVGYNSSGIDILPLDGGRGRALRYREDDEQSLGPNTVSMISEDSHHDVWVGTYQGGLQRYDRASGRFDVFEVDEDNPHSIAGRDIRGMAEDDESNLWILTHGQGLSYWDRETGYFSNFRRDPGSPAMSLIDDWPYSILFGSDDLIYVGTAVGLSVLKPESMAFRNFAPRADEPEGLSNSVINCIFEDSQNRVWLGSNDGLILFDASTGRGKTYTVEQGMPNRVVVSIIEDDSGLLWAGTYNGLARLNPESGDIKAYDAEDGLVHNEFFPRSVAKSEDGTLYFGQKNGITYFKPGDIRDNTYIPQVHLTSFKLFNKEVPVVPDVDEPGVLNSHVLKADGIVLDYDQKVIGIEFVGLNFVQSSKNQYAYKLEGFEDDWNYLDSRKEVNYTNLSPGKYTFMVKASNNDGYWNPEPRSFKIQVLPPYWETIWFRGLLILIVVLIPALVVFLRTRQIRNQNFLLESTVNMRTHELKQAHDQLRGAFTQLESNQKQIQTQNEEMQGHRENLERLVRERTRELKLAKERAEHSDRLKSAFLANMSHEIRTPMNAIMGFLEILSFPDIEETDRQRFVGLINQSGHTLITLIDDILDLSKIEANEFEVQPEPTHIDELCHDIKDVFVQTLPPEKCDVLSIELQRDSSPVEGLKTSDPIVMQVDTVRLRQVLNNLMSNAVKFTDQGFVRLNYGYTESSEGLFVFFEVTDTGIGISASELELIFQRFVKATSNDRKLYRGTGLGLTISDKLARLMGGRITVKSEEGEGSIFTLTLPFMSVEQEASAGASHAEDSAEKHDKAQTTVPDFHAYSILVAEDEVPNFEYISKLLERTGVKVVWAMDGEETLAKYAEEHFDLLLLDLKMPVKNGYEVLKEIRGRGDDIPVIVLSAFAMNEDRQKSLAAGANDFLGKPFSVDELLDKISDYLVS